MKLEIVFAIISCFLLSEKVSAQLELDLECTFGTIEVSDEPDYACTLNNVDFDFTNPFYFIRINGTHLEGRDNSDVTMLRIVNSSINTIPGNIFNVLPNIQIFEILNSGSIQLFPPNFGFAQQLTQLWLRSNNISVIFGIPFFLIGWTLEVLDLSNNGINMLQPDVFFGLSSLTVLSLAGNNLRTLSPRIFPPLVNVREILLQGNLIETLDGRLFNNNRQLTTLVAIGNQINSIGPNILNPLDGLRSLFLSGNNCTDRDFVNETRGDIRAALQTCFNNFIDPPVTGNDFAFIVQGNLTILDQNGYELFRITN